MGFPAKTWASIIMSSFQISITWKVYVLNQDALNYLKQHNFSKKWRKKLAHYRDVHFLNREDHEAHDVMICIGTGKLLFDSDRMRYSPEVHFKTAEEMRALFADYPEACDNTLEIAERCNVTLHLDATSSYLKKSNF